jgi:hypothetical protein
MARLTDMIEKDELTEGAEVDAREALIEALETLIEMVEDNALNLDEIEVLDEAISFIAEDFEDSVEEELTEKKMSPAAKMKAKKYRMKNKGKLKMIAKKKKRCMVKIAGKTDKMACGSDGRVHRIDKARARAAARGARSR